MIDEGSRNWLTEVVRQVDSFGADVVPAFVDSRPRVAAFAADDKVVVATQATHWAVIGLKYLNDANAWWVIADLSGVIDPFELREGDRLRVPSLGRFRLSILPGERGASGRRG